MNFEQQQEIDRLSALANTPSSNQNKHRHNLYAYIDEIANRRFNPETQVAIVWSIEDVKELDESLTDEQALEVLKNFENHHEGSMEQMWLDLQYHLDEFKSEKR